MKRTLMLVAAMAVVALGAGWASAGEYHVGETLVCNDCHTMHFSMQHGWAGSTVVGTAPGSTPETRGDWLGSTGPNTYLLKAPANQLCLACHDGSTAVPDVYGTNTNLDASLPRSAGALNSAAAGAGYDFWKGHTLDSTDTPPGWNPAAGGFDATWYNALTGLECVSCHLNHGIATAYRNLGPRGGFGGTTATTRPTYVISSSNNTSQDVWINLAAYTPGTGAAGTFNPYYSSANIHYNRLDGMSAGGAGTGTVKTSNRMGNFCAGCHGNFHGAPGDDTIGGEVATGHMKRHPTAQVVIGSIGGGHSNYARFRDAATKVKVQSNTPAATGSGYTDAVPGCMSCHKSHGNLNPFGLVFLNRNATSVTEEGGYGPGQTADTGDIVNVRLRNLCGQCHVQGN
jgi:hypothetical protein